MEERRKRGIGEREKERGVVVVGGGQPALLKWLQDLAKEPPNHF